MFNCQLNWLREKSVFISFNILNVLIAGNLPPLGRVSVVIEEQGRYLFIEISKGCLIFPGGFIRWNESPSQAAIRECLEETGLHVKLGNIIGYISAPSKGLSQLSTLTFVYQGKIISGELRGSTEGYPSWHSEPESTDEISSAILNCYLRSDASNSIVNV